MVESCIMQPDIDKYLRYLDGFDLSQDEKIEFIHTAWAISESCLDRALGDDPVQLALRERTSKRAIESSLMIEFSKGADGTYSDKQISKNRKKK